MANDVWTQIRLLTGAVCSGPTLFAHILNLSVMLVNYLQQTTSADNIFRCIFFLVLLVLVITLTSVLLCGIWFLPDVEKQRPYHQTEIKKKHLAMPL